MTEVGLSACLSSTCSWLCHHLVESSSFTDSSCPSHLDSCRSDQGRDKQLAKHLFSKPSQWYSRLEDAKRRSEQWRLLKCCSSSRSLLKHNGLGLLRSPQLSNLRHKRTRETRRLESQKKKLGSTDSRIVTLDTQQQTVQRVPAHLEFKLHNKSENVTWPNTAYQPRSLEFYSRLATLHVQVRKCLSVGFYSSIDEVKRLCKEEQLDRALDVLIGMDSQDSVPPVSMYRSLLKACSRRKSLIQAKQVHAHLVQNGLGFTRLLGEYVVSTLVKCGGLEDALQIFHQLSDRTVFSWTAVISGYTATGQAQEALKMYRLMQEEGVQPNTYTFVSLLQACASIPDLEEGKRIHAEVLKYGCESDLFVGTCLVDMYAKCGSIVDAQNIFDGLSQRSVVSWTAMLAAYAQQGQVDKALQLYDQMWKEGVSPNERTFVSVLQACGMIAEKEDDVLVGQQTRLMFLRKGKAIHADARSKGYESDVFVSSTLISMYGKFGSVVDAQNVFSTLSQRTVVTWNAMLTAYAQQGQAEKVLQLYRQMQRESVSGDVRTFVTVLQACGMLAEKEEDVVVDGLLMKIKSLEQGKAIDLDVSMMGHASDVFVGNSLVSMYGKCGSIVDAQNVFDALHHPDVVAWTAMVAAYAQQRHAEKALQLYKLMQGEGVSPNDRTFVSMLQACIILVEKEEDVVVNGRCMKVKSLEMGKVVHADAWRKGYKSDVFIGSILVSMYGKCGSISDAQVVFDQLKRRDVVAWTTMLAAYAQQGEAETALQLYTQMQEEGVSPNDRTFVSVLQACGILAEKEEHVVLHGRSTKVKSLEQGKAIHADACRKGFDSDVFVGNTLVSMYGKCGSIMDAQDVFDGLAQRSVVSWNALISAYVEQGLCEKAVQLYRQLQENSLTPNEITAVCILQACSNQGSLEFLRQIHHSLVSPGNNLSPLLATSLIHAYGRCASMVDAQNVFNALLQPDVVSWNALIAGYARQGDSAVSLQVYGEMLLAGMKPDGATFLSLLSACSHAGLVDEGIEYFESMSRDHGTSPTTEHYVCMVDLLGRAGDFIRVEDMLLNMPMQPNLTMWLCLLAACRKHGKVTLGKRAFDSAVCLQPKHTAAYVLMSSIYSHAGMWDCAKEVYALEKQTGAWKKPAGQSWIEHQQEVHDFVVADRKHPEWEQLYHLVENICFELEEEGLLPHMMNDVGEQGSDQFGDSENIARATWLLTLPDEQALPVAENIGVVKVITTPQGCFQSFPRQKDRILW